MLEYTSILVFIVFSVVLSVVIPAASYVLGIKKLDHEIRVIPILDKKMCLVDVITKENLPEIEERPVFARSKSPVRISFGGGGSDITNYFFDNGVGAVINSTISFYTHATLHIRNDSKIIIKSVRWVC